MRPSRMTTRTLISALALLSLPTAGIIAEDRRQEGPLPGSRLGSREAVDQADIIAIGKDFTPRGAGGGMGWAIWLANVTIEGTLKGEVPKGKLVLNSVLVVGPET